MTLHSYEFAKMYFLVQTKAFLFGGPSPANKKLILCELRALCGENGIPFLPALRAIFPRDNHP
jgi:hypothetical protein